VNSLPTSDYLAAIALIISLATMLYKRGVSEEKTIARIGELERKTESQIADLKNQLKAWADGLGKLARDIRSKEERRWKFQIIACVEASETLEQAKKFVNQLREDAFRD
jgi:hypothetical protein